MATTVLAVGENTAALLASQSPNEFTQIDAHALIAGEYKQRADFAIAQITADMASQARPLIASLRDVYAKRSLLFVAPKQLGWDARVMTGLGYTLMANYEIEGIEWQAWSFDIRTYKAVPDWLNPKFWANPENWNKFRW